MQKRVGIKLEANTPTKNATEEEILQFMKKLMDEEYHIIPDKERIGKGSVYIAKTIGLQCYRWLKTRFPISGNLYKFIDKMIMQGDAEQDRNLYNLGLVIFAFYIAHSGFNFRFKFNSLEKYATHPNWEIREMAGFTIRECVKLEWYATLSTIETFTRSEDENLRRLVSESLRPLSDIPRMRDPEQNDFVLGLLRNMKADPSIYVRKSVGNNLKDLTKYMPEKILRILKAWGLGYNIDVTDDLSSKTKKELGAEPFYFIWMMKHALRWLRERNPEFHTQIEELLGKNYILYFDEKRNRLAKPPK